MLEDILKSVNKAEAEADEILKTAEAQAVSILEEAKAQAKAMTSDTSQKIRSMNQEMTEKMQSDGQGQLAAAAAGGRKRNGGTPGIHCPEESRGSGGGDFFAGMNEIRESREKEGCGYGSIADAAD